MTIPDNNIAILKNEVILPSFFLTFHNTLTLLFVPYVTRTHILCLYKLEPHEFVCVKSDSNTY